MAEILLHRLAIIYFSVLLFKKILILKNSTLKCAYDIVKYKKNNNIYDRHICNFDEQKYAK